jgi:hypothetical protein
MKSLGHTDLVSRFLSMVIKTDVILAGIVGFACFLLGLRTAEAYSTALLRVGILVIILACIMVFGGFSARVQDVGAFTLTGAGDQSENLMRISESRQSSFGCFLQLLAAGFGLVALGYLLPVIWLLFEYVFGLAS